MQLLDEELVPVAKVVISLREQGMGLLARTRTLNHYPNLENGIHALFFWCNANPNVAYSDPEHAEKVGASASFHFLDGTRAYITGRINNSTPAQITITRRYESCDRVIGEWQYENFSQAMDALRSWDFTTNGRHWQLIEDIERERLGSSIYQTAVKKGMHQECTI